jgi:hypothetical protein
LKNQRNLPKPTRSKGANDCGFGIADCGFEFCQTTNPKSKIPNPKSEDTLTACVFLHFSRNFAVFKQLLNFRANRRGGEDRKTQSQIFFARKRASKTRKRQLKKRLCILSQTFIIKTAALRGRYISETVFVFVRRRTDLKFYFDKF